MKQGSLRLIMESLDREGVRFLVAGGLAVNAHGLLRATADVDIVIRLAPENITRTFTALGALGFRPLVPVTTEAFSDPQTRAGWIAEKGMRVLQFHSDAHRTVTVDVFVEEPFPFDEEYARSLAKELSGGVVVRFVSLPTLLRMKEAAGRPQDLADIAQLRQRLNP